jgi:S1-C subfamily serine protease
VSAGEKEVFHSFEVNVERLVGPSTAGPTKPTPKPTKPGDKPSEAEPSTARERQASEKPVKIDAKRLELPVAKYLVRPGQQGHLLVQGQSLTPLGPDGITPEKTIDLKKPYVLVAERSTYYVAVSREPMAVELIDKKTLAVSKSMKFSAMEINDLVLHPTKPLAYVAHKVQPAFPRYRFLIYNESTGEGRQSDDYLGESLAIDPSGKFLIAGYSDIFEKGSQLLFNPNQIHVVPTYGSVDWIIRYELDGAGNAKPGAMHEKAGGNGRGIRLSRDGKRVTYLSVVGSPSHSANLTAWDVNDFDKVPVTYPLKGKAATTEFAYHPYLPWVAAMGKEGAVIFDRETGDELPGKLNPDDFEGGALHALWFSADGKALVYDVSVNDIHYLQRIPLKLAADQQRSVDDQFKKSASTQPLSPSTTGGKSMPKEKVTLTALHALQGGTGKAMTAKDVAKWFTDAVVVVQTPTGNGTGMIVGSDGYILTCAHCIEGAEEIEVSYRRPVEGEVKSVTTKATLINSDAALDVALLKIKAPLELRTVRLASSSNLASGERVFVIGNPGVSATILDYTITEGIISSPARKLGEASYIQTSAQVNPGSSGGPMFNENGLVIGQVVAKATKIEGAGFATPGDELLAFLVRSVDLSSGMDLRRDWMDSTGQRRIEAKLREIGGDAVTLTKLDGSEVTVPLERLSKPDQALIRLLQRRMPKR